MESNRIVIAALLFILLIVVINAAMVVIARGAAKGSGSRWMSALRNSLGKPLGGSSNKSMEELRKRVEELEGKKNGE